MTDTNQTMTLEQRILTIVANECFHDIEIELTEESRLDELGLDSFDRIELAMAMEENLGLINEIADTEVEAWVRISDITNTIERMFPVLAGGT